MTDTPPAAYRGPHELGAEKKHPDESEPGNDLDRPVKAAVGPVLVNYGLPCQLGLRFAKVFVHETTRIAERPPSMDVTGPFRF